MRWSLFGMLLVLLFLCAGELLGNVTIFPGLTGKQLIDSVRLYYRPSHTIAYAGSPDARDTLFGVIEKTAQDSVTCVYSTFTIYMQPGQDPDDWAYTHGINAEHTWPQTYLNTGQSPDPTGDMNHLFACDVEVNSSRGSWPFAEIPDAQTETWFFNNTTSSTIPSSNIDLYAEYGSNKFEPREQQKGVTARAMFYMLTMYQLPDTTLPWWTGQRDILYQWHCDHPATSAESLRTAKVAVYQSGRVNPFIMDSTLIRRCYFPWIPTNTQLNFAASSGLCNESAGSVNLSVNISNPSGSVATTVQVVLAGGTGTAEDVGNYTTQTLTFPAGSSAPQSVTLSITDDVLIEGSETVVFKLRNASGGTNASIGADSVYTLTIEDNDLTLVSFSPPSLTKAEGDAPFNITAVIANPSGSAATSAEVVLAGGTGTAADVNDYTTQTVTFPAGSSASQSVQITITDDALAEGTETLIFKLRNVSGGSSAAAGADSAFTLTLGDNEATVPGPFLETMGTVATTTTIAVHESNNGFDNDGLSMSGTADVRITTPSTGYAGASGGANIFITNTVGRYFLIEGINTTAKADYSLSFGIHKSTTASNGSDLVVEVSSDGTNFSPLTFSALPTGTGTAIWHYRTASGTIPAASNLRIQFRQTNTTTQYRIDDVELERVLAVELASFSALASDRAITLSWRTETENGSYQWIVERADSERGPFAELGRLPAAGTSQTPKDYSWSDVTAQAGKIYYYRLGELTQDGQLTYFGPVSCTMGRGLPQVDLVLGCAPNPFRQITDIRYQIAKPSPVSLKLYNIAGQCVKTLVSEFKAAGYYEARWDGRDDEGRKLSAGVYIYRLQICGRDFVGKMQLVR